MRLPGLSWLVSLRRSRAFRSAERKSVSTVGGSMSVSQSSRPSPKSRNTPRKTRAVTRCHLWAPEIRGELNHSSGAAWTHASRRSRGGNHVYQAASRAFSCYARCIASLPKNSFSTTLLSQHCPSPNRSSTKSRCLVKAELLRATRCHLHATARLWTRVRTRAFPPS